jgi:predicted NBD/HSP70 family sugar kinase
MATPYSIRYLNELRALNVLFRNNGMSRADLARALGLNRSTTGNIIANLRADSLVVERPELERGPEVRTGRPGIQIELDPNGGTFIGAEIGVDRITVVAIDLTARELQRKSIAFDTAERAPDEGIDAAVELIQAVIASIANRQSIRGLCVSLPALLDREGNVVNALLLGWRNIPLRANLIERIGEEFPIVIENDANAFGIAESYVDTSLKTETIAFLLIENGVGGGIVIGGQLFRGSAGHAGEFGQVVLGGEGFYRGRTRPGHLESYVGKDALLARYYWHGADLAATLEDFLAALNKNDPLALKTADDWGQKLALGLTQVASVLNPTSIILGGSVSPVFASVADSVAAAMEREFIEGFPSPRVTISKLGLEGPALGGALLMHQHMFSVDEKVLHPGERDVDRVGAD